MGLLLILVARFLYGLFGDLSGDASSGGIGGFGISLE
jgi:hypothetical protein